jgi:two-component system OmpR family response regulator
MTRILVIEDDVDTAAEIADCLIASGFAAEQCFDGQAGLERAAGEDFDAITLDRMLPGLDGLDLVRTLRELGSEVPVLMVSALSDVDDRVTGLRAGGDDYLVKPFAFEELMARLTALARRPTLGAPQTVLKAGDLEMDLVARTVRRNGEAIDLQPREFRLLEFLLRAEGRLVTRKMLLEQVWDYHFDAKTNIVETHISRSRGKIDRDGPSLIQTMRGAGYMLRVPNPTA